MLTIETIKNWSLERCNEELGAAGHYSLHNDVTEAREAVAAMAAELDLIAEVTREYSFATDASSGSIIARSFTEACGMLKQMLPSEVVEDGAWGWVEDVDGYRCRINC